MKEQLKNNLRKHITTSRKVDREETKTEKLIGIFLSSVLIFGFTYLYLIMLGQY